MKIQNLRKHLTNGVVDYYLADLVEEGVVIPVKFTQDANHVFSLTSGLMYPICVANGAKINIVDFRDGDIIELGNAIKRDI